MAQIKTYFGCCVRNCDSYLPAVFANIQKIAELFNDFQIIVSYDISQDKSLKTLCEIKKQIGPRMDILINREPLTHLRTQNIANARNRILDYIREKSDSSFEYFIMIDMDNVNAGNMNINVLRTIVERERQTNPLPWDALSFNRTIYYDAWALSVEPFLFSCWHFQNGGSNVALYRQNIGKKLDEMKDIPDSVLPCVSAFNGFGIYRTSIFLDKDFVIRYEGTIAKTMEIMPKEWIIETSRVLGQSVNMNREDDCEHRYFHMRATQLNGARICISPLLLFTDLID